MISINKFLCSGYLGVASLLMAVPNASVAAYYPSNFTCSAKSYAGKKLPQVTVFAGGQREAQGKAMGIWRGQAVYNTIQCRK
jgi:hypothetical protein